MRYLISIENSSYTHTIAEVNDKQEAITWAILLKQMRDKTEDFYWPSWAVIDTENNNEIVFRVRGGKMFS